MQSTQAQQTLSYHVASTLDGFIARTDHSFDCFLNEGPHVTDFVAAMQQYGTVLMGRRTYEIGLTQGVTNPYPWLRTVVFSASLSPSSEPKIQITADDPVQRVRALKAESGKGIWLCGGSKLASTLFAADLVDELIVKLNPVLLGEGIPIVTSLPRQLPLSLRSHKQYDNGVALLSYDVIRADTELTPRS